MQLALIAIISLIAGAALGYFFAKAKAQQIIIAKSIAEKELELLKTQQQNFERLRNEERENSRAAMIAASREVSQELLNTHKLESKEVKEEAAKITQRETEALHNEFKAVVEQLANLKGQHQNNDKKLSAIWQSLTSPVKAANFAEIGLENTLKNFGLEMGVDFVTQSNIEGTALRPDAVINLPSGNKLVIDAKTSKYFIEIAAAEDDAETLKAKLKASMGTHLAALAKKDYASKSDGTYVVNVMYLPNDAAYGRVLECDAGFEQKCREAGVLLVTPTSLHMLLSIASHQISRMRQEQNYQHILKEMGKVISSVDNMLRGLNEVGLAIKRSADAFSKLSGPINSRVIPRIKNVLKLGLEPEREVKLPGALPNFNIIENEPVLLDAETTEPRDNLRTLEKKAG